MSRIHNTLATAAVLVVALILATPAHANDDKWKLGVKLFAASGGGVKIAEVFPHSPAAEIGLKPGNVILVLGGKLVNKPDEAREKVFAAKDEIDIIYQDGNTFYQITTPLVSQTYSLEVDGKRIQKEKLVPKGKIEKKRVADPRKKK